MIYKFSQAEVLELSSKSKTARKFFESVYPGSTFTVFKSGWRYIHDKYGEFILTVNGYPDGVNLFSTVNGQAFFRDQEYSIPPERDVLHDEHPKKATFFRSEIEDVFYDLSSWVKQPQYKFTDYTISALLSHSRSARALLEKKYPGSNLRRFYTGSVYNHKEFGRFLFCAVGDGAFGLINLETGNRYAEHIHVKTDVSRDTDQWDPRGSTYLLRKEVKELFQDFSLWTKI